MVLLSHWSDKKLYVATGRQITDARREQKRSRYKQSSLLIKDFKYGPSLSILPEKNISRQTVKRTLIFHHDNITTAEFNSGISYQEIEGKNTVQRVL